jgi:hypothetical protein
LGFDGDSASAGTGGSDQCGGDNNGSRYTTLAGEQCGARAVSLVDRRNGAAR